MSDYTDCLYRYRARCERVIDGDTYDLTADCGFGISNRIRVRLAEYDTPELRAKDPAERERAELAERAAYVALMANSTVEDWNLRIETDRDKKGGFGRYIARVSFWNVEREEWADLGEHLEAMGLAVKYKR